MALPTRRTSELDLDQFNTSMRSTPWYQAARQRMGPGALSRSEQSELEQLMAANGMGVEGGMHVDSGGNVNQKNRLGRNVAIGAGIAAGGYFAAPAIMAALSGGAAAGGAGGLSAGMLPGVTAGLGTAGAAGAAGGASGAGAGLLSALGGKAGMLSAGSRMLGAFGQSEANNRGVNLSATQNQDQLRLAGAGFDRAGQTDALRKAASTDYLLSGGRPYVAPEGTTAIGFGPSAPSAARQQIAKQIQDELLARTAPGGGFQVSDTSRYMRPGGGERFANILGPAAGIASQYFGR